MTNSTNRNASDQSEKLDHLSSGNDVSSTTQEGRHEQTPGGTIRSVSDLPIEVIVLLGDQLSEKDLAKARQTSKFLSHLWSPIFFRKGCTHVRSGMMGLEWAVSRNREAIVRRMLETRPDMSLIRNSAGLTPLHLAADQGMVDMMKLLLEADPDLSLQSKMGDTPLHRASKIGHLEVVRIILEQPSSTDQKPSMLDTKNADGNTPVVLAAKASHRPIVHLLLSHGADTTIEKERGRTLLHTASALGFAHEIRKLLEGNTISIAALDNQENTAFHLACSSSCLESAKLLLDHGANISAQNERKETPLHLAASSGNGELIKLLIDSGADIEAMADNDDTPILHVESSGSVEAMQVLLEAGANVHAKTMEGITAMTMADEQGDKEMIRVLIAAGAEPPDYDWENELE